MLVIAKLQRRYPRGYHRPLGLGYSTKTFRPAKIDSSFGRSGLATKL
jgi:hypothetical protein